MAVGPQAQLVMLMIGVAIYSPSLLDKLLGISSQERIYILKKLSPALNHLSIQVAQIGQTQGEFAGLEFIKSSLYTNIGTSQQLQQLVFTKPPQPPKQKKKSTKSGEKIKIRTSNKPGHQQSIEIEYPDGRIKDINKDRVKEWVPEPRAKGGKRPVKFDNALPGSKGKKRAPTKDELKLLEETLNGSK